MGNRVKFYKCKQLPEEGQPGGLYFLESEKPTLFLCTGPNTFECYGGYPVWQGE